MEAQSQHTYGKGGISTKNQGGETLEKNNKSFYFNILMQKTKHDQKKKIPPKFFIQGPIACAHIFFSNALSFCNQYVTEYVTVIIVC